MQLLRRAANCLLPGVISTKRSERRSLILPEIDSSIPLSLSWAKRMGSTRNDLKNVNYLVTLVVTIIRLTLITCGVLGSCRITRLWIACWENSGAPYQFMFLAFYLTFSASTWDWTYPPNAQHRIGKIIDGGAEDALSSICLRSSSPQLQTNIATPGSSVKELFGDNLALNPYPPLEPNQKREEPILSSL